MYKLCILYEGVTIWKKENIQCEISYRKGTTVRVVGLNWKICIIPLRVL